MYSRIASETVSVFICNGCSTVAAFAVRGNFRLLIVFDSETALPRL
jgi:hypothetical protein